jgi:hypothetical protein
VATTAWMIFGTTGRYVTNANLPPDFRSMAKNYVQNEGWVITAIYCYPDTNGYVIFGTNGGISWSGSFPSDFAGATWPLKNPGDRTPLYLSWQAAAEWPVFCSDGAYAPGPNVPSQVSTSIPTLSNTHDPLVFSPRGYWLLIGNDKANEGVGSYPSSSGFPADVLVAANALPDHAGEARVTLQGCGQPRGFSLIGWPVATSGSDKTARVFELVARGLSRSVVRSMETVCERTVLYAYNC